MSESRPHTQSNSKRATADRDCISANIWLLDQIMRPIRSYHQLGLILSFHASRVFEPRPHPANCLGPFRAWKMMDKSKPINMICYDCTTTKFCVNILSTYVCLCIGPVRLMFLLDFGSVEWDIRYTVIFGNCFVENILTTNGFLVDTAYGPETS